MDFEQRNKITEKTFGEFVKRRREKLGIPAKVLAEKLNISAVYLCDVESANRPAPRREGFFEQLVAELCLTEDEQQYLYKAALASRTEDIGIYLKDNPRVCVALRMAQELPEETVQSEWEHFIKRLIEINSNNDT